MRNVKEETLLNLNGKTLVKVKHNGSLYTFKELSQKVGLGEGTLRLRYSQGLRGEELIAPIRKSGRRSTLTVEYRGKSWSYYDLSKKTGISTDTLRLRYKRGLRGEDLIKSIKKHGGDMG